MGGKQVVRQEDKIRTERVLAAHRAAGERLQADREAALISKTVTIRLLDTYYKVGEARGFRIECDEPDYVGGENLAPQPTEFMLMSLGFCQMSIIVDCAASMRLPLDDVEIAVTGYRDDRGLMGLGEARPGYYEIVMETRLASAAPVGRLEKLAALAERRCPVFDNLSNPTRLRNRVVRGDELVRETDSSS